MAAVAEQVKEGPVVEVTHRWGNSDYASIPQSVKDAFEAQGKRLTVASSLSGSRAMLSTWARYPLTEEDLRAVSRKGPKDEFDALKVMRIEGAFNVNKEGFLEKFDCIVYVQPIDAYEAQHREALEEWMRQDDPSVHEAHFRDLQEEHLGANGLFGHLVGPGTTSLSRPIGRLGDSIGHFKQE